MGMAASQARFLSLTARKSNVEFQGQQVNQQRTTLSNESAAYNSQLLTMKVPTAPSSDTYTKVTYTTKDSADRTYTLNNIQSNPDGTYTVTMGYTTTGTASADANGQFVKTADGEYSFNKKALAISTDTASLQKAYGDSYVSTQNYYSFVKSSTTDSAGNTTEVLGYISQKALTDALGSSSVGSSQYLDYKYLQDNQTINQTATWSNIPASDIKYASSGRLESIKYDRLYEMSSTTTTDNDAYNDATNEYNYQKEVYNQTLNEINAKLSIIQQQDKNLELKLKDLDTEQSAISTELDAVKKVISKNVESTFKTFNA